MPLETYDSRFIDFAKNQIKNVEIYHLIQFYFKHKKNINWNLIGRIVNDKNDKTFENNKYYSANFELNMGVYSEKFGLKSTKLTIYNQKMESDHPVVTFENYLNDFIFGNSKTDFVVDYNVFIKIENKFHKKEWIRLFCEEINKDYKKLIIKLNANSFSKKKFEGDLVNEKYESDKHPCL